VSGNGNVRNGLDLHTVHRALFFCKFSAPPPLAFTSRREKSNSVDGAGHQHVELAFVTADIIRPSLLTI